MRCAVCKGRGFCGTSCPILQSLKKYQPKISNEFSGSSPPEIFVGRWNYPNVWTGILAPVEHGETEKLSMPEVWHAEQADISKILEYRSQLIYSRFVSNVSHANQNKNQNRKALELMQEIALASKSTSVEIVLKKKPAFKVGFDAYLPIIGNPALLKYARLQENPKVEKKVDYLTSDTEVKAANAIAELHESRIATSSIIKILSAGMLGLKQRRKLVPTRWAVTATDSTISNLLLEKIKYYPQINSFLLFNSEYIGNHYEILLFPAEFSFEVLEAKFSGSVWNPSKELYICADYESWYGRKEYASNVGGGYYAPRLAVMEYLSAIKRQASVLIMRECRPEYWAPCGVGILRETVREALSKKPEKFDNLQAALDSAQKRMKLPVSSFLEKSKIFSEHKKQKRLSDFLN